MLVSTSFCQNQKRHKETLCDVPNKYKKIAGKCKVKGTLNEPLLGENPETGTMTVFIDLSTRGQDQLQKDSNTEGSTSSYCIPLIHCYMVRRETIHFIHFWTPLACTTSLQPQLSMSTQKEKRQINGQQFRMMNKIRRLLDAVSFLVRKRTGVKFLKKSGCVRLNPAQHTYKDIP